MATKIHLICSHNEYRAVTITKNEISEFTCDVIYTVGRKGIERLGSERLSVFRKNSLPHQVEIISEIKCKIKQVPKYIKANFPEIFVGK